jgi:hypothetical protein
LQVDDSGGTLRNISNDVRSISVRTPRGMQEITGIDKSGIERLLLRSDGHIELRGVFNPTANMSHDVFKTVPSTAVVRTVTWDPTGTATGDPRLSMEMLFSDYTVEAGEDGSLVWTAVGDLADGTAPSWTTVP